MMRDKSLGILLIVLFGVSGIAVLLLGWLWPMLEPDRIIATLAGSVGLLIASTQVPTLRRLPVKTDDEPVPAKIEVESKS